MTVITTGNHPKALWPGVKAWFGVGYGEHPEEYKDLFTIETSTQAYEEDVQLKGFGLLQRKNEGSPVTYAGQTQGFVSRYTHIAWALGFIVTYEELLNNLYAKVAGSRAKALGFSKRQTKENVAANVYNRAFTSTYSGGDGQELCSEDHPCASGTQSNYYAADISEQTLEEMDRMVMDMTDDSGLKISLMSQTLIVPTELWYEANRILKSVLTPETSNNAANVLKMTNAFPGGIKLNHYLTDADAFFIRTNCPDGMKMYQRHSYDLKQDNDFDTDTAKAKTYDYYSVGWSDFRGVVGSPGA